MKKLLIFLVVLAVLVVVGGMFLPAERHVERSIAVNRPAATVFELLNSYRTFNEWSPWARLDPDAEYAYVGPESGVGARMEWSGDPALVGSGWQEITESVPYERIAMHLDFGPQGRANTYFEIRGDQLGSRVTWGFDTNMTEDQGFFGGLMGRYFGLMLDRWVGGDYEKGLASFKAFAESLPAVDFSDADIRLMDVEPVTILAVSGESSQQSEAIAAALAQAYGEIMGYISAQGLVVNGQPMSVTRDWADQRYAFDAAIPIDASTLPPDGSLPVPAGNVRLAMSPGGKSARIVHVGPYSDSQASYDKLLAWMSARGLREGALTWEHYISDPGDTSESDLITHIYFQVAENEPER